MNNTLAPKIEALLFVKSEGIGIEELAGILEEEPEAIKTALEVLGASYERQGRGIQMIKVGALYQLATHPTYEDLVAQLTPVKKTSLTMAQLETLAIIAHTQPTTRADIERIRGVDSIHSINKLIGHDLITEAGRAEQIGRPILFVTTDDFLRHFKLEDLSVFQERL